MPGNIVRLIFTGDNASVLRAQREIAASSEDTGKVVRAENDETIVSNDETAGSFERMRGSVGLLAGAIGLGVLAYGIKDVIQGGEKWQAQQAQLQAALKSTGNYSQAALTQINASATALSTKGGVGTPEQIAAITQFIGETGKLSTAQKLNIAATDLARTGLMSYTSAVSDLSAAQNGTSRGLQKFIGSIVPITRYTIGWTAAMRDAEPAQYAQLVALNHNATAMLVQQAIIKKYGDATSTYNHTVSGMTSNLINTLDNLITKIELKLLPDVEKLLLALMSVVQWVVRNWPTISRVFQIAFAPLTFIVGKIFGLRSALEVAGAALGAFLAYSAAIRIFALYTAVADSVMNLFSTELVLTEAGIYANVGAIATLGTAIDAIPIVGWIALAVTAFILLYNHVKIFRDFVNSVVTFIAQNWKMLLGIILLPFLGPIEFIVAKFQWLKKTVMDIVGWIIKTFKSVEHFLGFGTSPAATIHVHGHTERLEGIAGYQPTAKKPPPRGSTGVRTNDSVPANSALAGFGGITLYHTTKIGQKVVAQETVHFAQKQLALST
jgi:hypothetical protein